ncbi:unnamed protein product [Rhizophagus irregularis]|nr:unnamed protein product [Rhizophagus irregularis]
MTPFASNKINIPISETLTPNQKRHLLFNVNQPLELSIEEFDKEWWPLVSNVWTRFSYKNNVNGDSWKVFICQFSKPNKSSTRKEGVSNKKCHITKIRLANICSAKIKVQRYISEQKVRIERFQDSPDHSHTLKESERLKRSQIVRDLVIQEAVKNYRPPEIVSAKEGGYEHKIHGSLDAHLIGNPKRELDIREAISFLEKEEYLVNYYEIPHLSIYGFVFIHPDHIKNLEQHGWLTLIDSTHKTNKYDCRLFTLYIRNYYGCWDVGAHFFVSNENSDTVAEGLKIIRRFARRWNPRYFLSDQSNIESNSIKMAFPGLKNGEQECEVFFCTVHIVRVWMNKIYDKKIRQKMIHAMHKRTRIGCENIVQEALNEYSNSTIKKYIMRNYVKNTHQWALWTRQHSPLLLQVTSTNSLESYHSELKRTTSPQHGLIGACQKIVALDKKKRADSEHVAYEFRTKKISAIGIDDEILDEIHKFPFPVQQMLINEFCAVEGRIEKGKAAPGLTSLNCNCLFFHRYLLPCHHIFHENMYGTMKLLIPDVWKKFQQMFDESGFEIYIHRELVDLEVPVFKMTEAEKAMENRRLAVSELTERIRDIYWRVEERGDKKKTGAFISELKNRLEPVLNTLVEIVQIG